MVCVKARSTAAASIHTITSTPKYSEMEALTTKVEPNVHTTSVSERQSMADRLVGQVKRHKTANMMPHDLSLPPPQVTMHLLAHMISSRAKRLRSMPQIAAFRGTGVYTLRALSHIPDRNVAAAMTHIKGAHA